MADYTLLIGTAEPYGFSASTEDAAVRHAADYIAGRHSAEVAANPGLLVTLGGPAGVLTGPDESITAFERRVASLDPNAPVDDVKPADPTIPDCNQA